MVKLTCPITGTVLYVDESRAEKYKKSGYKPAEVEKPKTRSKKPE